MEKPSIPAPVAAFAPEFARGLGLILRRLAEIVARRLLRDPRFRALIVPLWTRISRATHRAERLLANLAAGRLPRRRLPRPGLPRPGRPGRTRQPSPRPPDPRQLHLVPRGRGWLIRVLGYEAAGCASQLRALLAEPEAAALLAVLPSVARTIRPLRHLLDTDLANRRLRPLPPAPVQYATLPPMLSTEVGRPRPTEPWHRHYVVLRKTV